MINNYLARSFELPLQHKLLVESHSPRRHGHNLKVTLKIKKNAVENSLVIHEFNDWIIHFKSKFTKNLNNTLETNSDSQTTETIMLHILDNIKNDSQFVWDLKEVRIQETVKNQFVWTKN